MRTKTRPTRFIPLALCAASAVSSCANARSPDTIAVTASAVSCGVGLVRFPTTQEDFGHVYDGRVFYANGNHLGYDIAESEGVQIHPIACGVVRFAGPAKGYGTFVVVIEHHLLVPVILKNGKGESVTVSDFLSIYGHLRKSASRQAGPDLPIRIGDVIGPDDVLGYVQNDAENGDGAEHLHLGIRLQNMADAQNTDTAWFRGYDDAEKPQKKWFADPADFLLSLMSNGAAVRWHPAGTVLQALSRPGKYWMVSPDDTLRAIETNALLSDRLASRALLIDEAELACYRNEKPYAAELTYSRLMKFNDAPAVYEYRDWPSDVRYTFISYESFKSWGWRDDQISVRPASERAAFLARFADHGFRRLRDGSLVKGRGESEVAVVSDGRRLPIANWNTFLALGYKQKDIVEVDALTLDQVASVRGPLITQDTTTLCRVPQPCIQNGCDAGSMGGGTGEPPDLSAPPDMHVNAPRDMMNAPRDMALPADLAPPPDLSAPRAGIRYEFRVQDGAGWQAMEPFTLYNQWWVWQTCLNTGTMRMEQIGDWHRCELLQPLSPFVGNFFSRAHPDWGYKGNIATVGSFPQHCTPTAGVEWRLTDLSKNKVFFEGVVDNLPCTTVGQYDFHVLPPLP